MDGCTIAGWAFVVVQATISCPQPAVPVARYCELARTISYTRDTDAQLRRDLREHNATVRRVCGVRR